MTATLWILAGCVIAAEGAVIAVLARRSASRTVVRAPLGTTEHVNREKIAAIGTFASVVSHELKNPLASLKNIAYYFSKLPPLEDPRASRMLAILGSEVGRMDDMIVHLLDLSRVKNVEKTPCDIGRLAEEVIRETPVPETVSVTHSIEHITLPFDSRRFKQVIASLITNACDAMPGGGRIDVVLRHGDGGVEIIVSDAGCGMDTNTCFRAFDPLFTTKTKTLGMGLTMAREIVHIHDGTIAVASKKGEGTKVRILLPLP